MLPFSENLSKVSKKVKLLELIGETISAGNYLLNGNTTAICEICSKLTIKTPERCQWRPSSVFIVNFQEILHIVLMYPLLTLNKYKAVGMLTNEIYKFQAGLAPQIMSDLFVTRENKFNLRNFQALEFPRKRTVKFRTETISFRELQIWNVIPKRLRTLAILKRSKK